jgi:hypothetical protein
MVAVAALVLLACSSSLDSNTGHGSLGASGFEKKLKLADGEVSNWKTNPKPDAHDGDKGKLTWE